jgi:hypothetical protein
MPDPSLLDLFEAAFTDVPPWFPASRQAPMKSHLLKYAASLGYDDLKACQPARYHLPGDQVRARLLNHVGTHLQPRSVKNLCNDVLALLHAGVAHGWLTPPPSPLHEWHGHRRITHGRYDRNVYPKGSMTRYALTPLPELLSRELEDYLAWCQKDIAKGRSWKIRKRAVTAHDRRGHVSRIAGYAVRYEGVVPEALTLRQLCEPAFLTRFADWYLERRQKSTDGLRDLLGTMHTISRHWLKDQALIDGIRQVFAGLPPTEAVMDKEALWLDLEEIDLIGQSRHPRNPRFLDGSTSWVRWLQKHMDDPQAFPVPSRLSKNRPGRNGFTLSYMAVWAEVSLMLRLWVRRPLRQRNMREMQLGTNLISQPNGEYVMVFKGEELKVARRGKHLNRWEAHFPKALLPVLDEYLHLWRPKIIPSPDFPYLFCNSRGRLYRTSLMTGLIEATTWEFTQGRAAGPVAINPHQIRSLWGSQMAIAGLNVIDLARLLGDNLQMVYERYVLMQQKRVVSPWTKDLAKAIADGVD